MDEESGWTFDILNASSAELVRVLGGLDENSQEGLQFNIKKELVERARSKGNTDEQIINTLNAGVPKGEQRNKIAKKWAKALGISEREFKRV